MNEELQKYKLYLDLKGYTFQQQNLSDKAGYFHPNNRYSLTSEPDSMHTHYYGYTRYTAYDNDNKIVASFIANLDQIFNWEKRHYEYADIIEDDKLERLLMSVKNYLIIETIGKNHSNNNNNK